MVRAVFFGADSSVHGEAIVFMVFGFINKIHTRKCRARAATVHVGSPMNGLKQHG